MTAQEYSGLLQTLAEDERSVGLKIRAQRWAENELAAILQLRMATESSLTRGESLTAGIPDKERRAPCPQSKRSFETLRGLTGQSVN